MADGTSFRKFLSKKKGEITLVSSQLYSSQQTSISSSSKVKSNDKAVAVESSIAHLEIDTADMVLYTRWLISKQVESKNVQQYLSQANQIISFNRDQIISECAIITNLNTGSIENNGSAIQYIHNISSFIANPPIKTTKLSDFITEFDGLCDYWKLETHIEIEDGLPFRYEVDTLFFDTIIEQSLDSTLLPYESSCSKDAESLQQDVDSATGILGGYSGNTGLSDFINSLSSITGKSSKPIPKSRFPRLKIADWVDNGSNPIIFADLAECDLEYASKLKELASEDLELLLEFDLLKSNDYGLINSRLKIQSKKNWTDSANGFKQNETRINFVAQSHEIPKLKNDIDEDLPYFKSFEFGMKTFGCSENIMTGLNILNAKKIAFGTILKDNLNLKFEDIKQKDKNLAPTISSVFAEHEILAYQQLRFLKIRQCKSTILKQFNYLRLVESRLVPGFSKDSAAIIAKMQRKLRFFDLNLQNGLIDKSKIKNQLDNAKMCSDGTIRVYDLNGQAVIYDLAIRDLANFESEALKILTFFINKDTKFGGLSNAISRNSYDIMLKLLSKNRNSTAKPTLLHPNIDRSQMLLEYMEAHIDFQNAKIDLINIYLDTYEHVVNSIKSKEIAQILCNLIQTKPILCFEADYFVKSFNIATQTMLLHLSLVESVASTLIAEHRSRASRYESSSGTFTLASPCGLKRKASSHVQQTVSLNHTSIRVDFTETIVELESITMIYDAIRSLSGQAYQSLYSISDGSFTHEIVQYVFLQSMLVNIRLTLESME